MTFARVEELASLGLVRHYTTKAWTLTIITFKTPYIITGCINCAPYVAMIQTPTGCWGPSTLGCGEYTGSLVQRHYSPGIKGPFQSGEAVEKDFSLLHHKHLHPVMQDQSQENCQRFSPPQIQSLLSASFRDVLPDPEKQHRETIRSFYPPAIWLLNEDTWDSYLTHRHSCRKQFALYICTLHYYIYSLLYDVL